MSSIVSAIVLALLTVVVGVVLPYLLFRGTFGRPSLAYMFLGAATWIVALAVQIGLTVFLVGPLTIIRTPERLVIGAALAGMIAGLCQTTAKWLIASVASAEARSPEELERISWSAGLGASLIEAVIVIIGALLALEHLKTYPILVLPWERFFMAWFHIVAQVYLSYMVYRGEGLRGFLVVALMHGSVNGLVLLTLWLGMGTPVEQVLLVITDAALLLVDFFLYAEVSKLRQITGVLPVSARPMRAEESEDYFV